MITIAKYDGVFEGLSFDQLQCFVTVVDHGSFSAAARAMGRAQSAVSAAVQRLEEQFGIEVFDRSGYRPVLTPAGQALLPRARRITSESGLLRAQARGLAAGVEAEVSVTLDSTYPMERFLPILSQFRATWPTVQPKIYVENMGATAEQVLNGQSMLGMLLPVVPDHPLLLYKPAVQIQLVMVASSHHPLAQWPGEIPAEAVSEHVQLVLTDRSSLLSGQDFGVMSPETWRLGDLGAKHAMLRAGLGWGSMPLHMISDDLAAGRLVRIFPAGWVPGRSMMLYLAHRIDAVIGPATAWLMGHLLAPHDGTSS
jgi:DNA-binding transcriptional LysR family regulator